MAAGEQDEACHQRLITGDQLTPEAELQFAAAIATAGKAGYQHQRAYALRMASRHYRGNHSSQRITDQIKGRLPAGIGHRDNLRHQVVELQRVATVGGLT